VLRREERIRNKWPSIDKAGQEERGVKSATAPPCCDLRTSDQREKVAHQRITRVKKGDKTSLFLLGRKGEMSAAVKRYARAKEKPAERLCLRGKGEEKRWPLTLLLVDNSLEWALRTKSMEKKEIFRRRHKGVPARKDG